MAKEIEGYLKLQVQGGQANPSPPVGPALGSKGLNIMDFCKQFNARTQEKKGQLLPVVVTIYKDKTFEFVIKTPPAAVMLLEKSGLKKGSGEPNRIKVGSVTWDQVKEIAEFKMADLNAFKVESAMKMIAGTARSMGLTVKGSAPWEQSILGVIMKLTKNQKKAKEVYDAEKIYSLGEASEIVKKITFTKFDASVDLDIRLGVDPRKADQMVRGIVALPNGTGKDQKVLVLCTPDKEEEAKAAGADYVGLDNLIKDIEGGWLDFDVMVTMPACMAKIGKLGRVLGPRGLMPNPKAGTVTPDVAKAVKEIKSGKIDFKVDKFGIVHASIGRASFSAEQIEQNAEELISTLNKLKPSSAKGIYMKSVSLSTTMSAGVKVEVSSITE